ncbi:VWA domain-containing protein [Candidatus Woesearchaeota archaeon]|nr:VWA domain-containing protein [Candidatus Woesearchaeota archaeon]
MKPSSKKTFLVAGSMLVLAVILLVMLAPIISAAKTDDWEFDASKAVATSPYTSSSFSTTSSAYFMRSMFAVLAIPGVIIIAWIALSIVLIVKGKPIEEQGTKKMSPKRFAGIAMLIFPFAISLLAFIAGWLMAATSQIELFAIVLGAIQLLWIAFLVWMIVYGARHKLKLVWIPAIAMLVLGFIMVVFIAFFGVMSPSAFKAGAPLQTMGAGGGIQYYGAKVAEASDTIGFSVGGAKDINNFRQNLNHSYLPLPTDITYEGLFYDYYFDTGATETCTKLFCPSYTSAISKDPFSEETEYYLSVGLNSGVKESDFKRKKLNLVIVLDVSGSMSSSFSKYYYDQFGRPVQIEGEKDTDASSSKMQVATKSIVAMLDHLNPDDRFGMVLFDNQAYLAKKLRLISETDMPKIKSHIMEIQPMGGTYMEAGMKMGTELFDELLDADQAEYENRIIFLTDAMPNIGRTDEESLLGMLKSNSDNKLYTTFIGIGVDFNTELVEAITKIRGANYYSVHSSSQFKERMDEEFEYMVTPLVFNLVLKLDARGYEIEKVIGSPEADEATGEIMKVNTLFPSKKEEGETKGGLVLLKLKKTVTSNPNLKLRVSYEDRSGNQMSDEKSISLPTGSQPSYPNNGIRKGILLFKYASLMKNWINDEREAYWQKMEVVPMVNSEQGIMTLPDDDRESWQLSAWERQSMVLRVSQEYKKLFTEFRGYFESEMERIEDPSLSREVDILNKLILQ